MKLLNALCFVVISLGTAYAQEIDERLLVKYSQSELESLIESSPLEYKLLDYALDNALYIADYTNVKGQTLETIVVDTENLPTFADLNLNIEKVNQYFKIVGENKVLVVKSSWVLNHEMEKN